jgi:protein TonB
MTALALHLPQYRGLSRWAFAALTIVLAHAVFVSSIVLWYARRPVEPPVILPAIAVTLLPVEASSPEIQNQDIAVGTAMQEAEEARKQPPEEEKPTEKMEQQPLPPQQDEIALPQVDVTIDIADELRRRYIEYDEVPASVLKFLETANRH